MTTVADSAVAVVVEGTEADRLLCWRRWRGEDTEDDSSESEALRREAISTVAVSGFSPWCFLLELGRRAALG